MSRIPPEGKRFQKGEVNNPLGAGAHNKTLKVISKLTREEIAEVATIILNGDLAMLSEVKNDHTASVLKIWICAVAITAIKKGDPYALNAILDRVCGKPKSEVELSGDVDNPISILTTSMTKEQIKERIDILLEKRNQRDDE